MKIDMKRDQSEGEKDINSPISEQIWKFVVLLSAKLEENSIPILFDEQKVNPTTNRHAKMLKCHRL